MEKKVLNILNKQINNELGNCYAYMVLASFFANQYYPGIAAYLRKQSNEEKQHAEQIIDFIEKLDGVVDYSNIEAFEYPTDVKNAGEIVCELENTNLESLQKMAKTCLDAEDSASYELSLALIKDQVDGMNEAYQFEADMERIANEGCSRTIDLIYKSL